VLIAGICGFVGSVPARRIRELTVEIPLKAKHTRLAWIVPARRRPLSGQQSAGGFAFQGF
jgi:hypothetical protein